MVARHPGALSLNFPGAGGTWRVSWVRIQRCAEGVQIRKRCEFEVQEEMYRRRFDSPICGVQGTGSAGEIPSHKALGVGLIATPFSYPADHNVQVHCQNSVFKKGSGPTGFGGGLKNFGTGPVPCSS